MCSFSQKIITYLKFFWVSISLSTSQSLAHKDNGLDNPTSGYAWKLYDYNKYSTSYFASIKVPRNHKISSPLLSQISKNQPFQINLTSSRGKRIQNSHIMALVANMSIKLWYSKLAIEPGSPDANSKEKKSMLYYAITSNFIFATKLTPKIWMYAHKSPHSASTSSIECITRNASL